MKAWLSLPIASSAAALFLSDVSGADADKRIPVERPVVAPSSQVVPRDVVAPAGQTFNRPPTTVSPAVPPQIPVKEGTFEQPQTFATPPGSFSRPESTFLRPPGTFSRPTGTFSRPASTFSTPAGSFSRPGSTFSNPTLATSPLPQGAFGTPIRPASTFALPPGGTTFSHPGTILPGATFHPQQASAAGSIGMTQTESAAKAEPPVVIDLPPGAKIRNAPAPQTQAPSDRK